jgi:hypothetical protein
MICKLLRRVERFLREHQDPRYRNAPWILPRVWHGSGGPLTREQLARFNVRDIGFDPAIVSQQPINRMLLATVRRAQKQAQTEKPQ